MLKSSTLLKHWLDEVQLPEASEAALCDGWQQLTPSLILSETGELVLEKSLTALETLWERVHAEEVEAFLFYLYHETRTYRDFAQHGGIEVPRLIHGLRGMIGVARLWGQAVYSESVSLLPYALEAIFAWAGKPSVSFQTPLTSMTPLDSPRAKIEALWQSLKQSVPPDALMLAQSWSERFLAYCSRYQPGFGGRSLEDRSSRVRLSQRMLPLLTYLQDGSGRVARLMVEAFPGSGAVVPDPYSLGLTPICTDFLSSNQTALQAIQAPEVSQNGFNLSPEKCDLSWWVEPLGETSPPTLAILAGRSHGAAIAVCLRQLLTGELLDASTTISATISLDGTFGAVTGIRSKITAAFSVRDERGEPMIRRIFLHPDNVEEGYRAALIAGRNPETSIFSVLSLREYVPEASGLLQEFRRVLEGERDQALVEASRRTRLPLRLPKDLERYYTPLQLQLYFAESDLLPEAEGLPSVPDVLEWRQIPLTGGCTLLIAPPGSGKSMSLLYETVQRTQETLTALQSQSLEVGQIRLCLLLRASEMADRMIGDAVSPEQFSAVVAMVIRQRYHLSSPAQTLLERKILQGDCLLCLDALDEAKIERRRELLLTVSAFTRQYPEVPFLLTSRREGYHPQWLPAEEVRLLEVLPFDEKRVRAVIQFWFDHPNEAETFWNSLREQKGLNEALRSPLLLRIACRAAKEALSAGRPLPRWSRRVELYASFLQDLLSSWAITPPFPDTVEQTLLLDLASELALVLLQDEISAGGRSAQSFPDRLNSLALRYPLLSKRNISEDLNRSGILTSFESGKYIAFAHRTLGEYLAARHLVKKVREEGWLMVQAQIDRYADHPSWHQMLLFFAGLLPDPTPLLYLLMKRERDDELRHRLALAALCLPEIAWEPLQPQ